MDELTRPGAPTSRLELWREWATRVRWKESPLDIGVRGDVDRSPTWEANGMRPSPLMVAVAAIGASLLIAGGALAVRQWSNRSQPPIDDQLPLLIEVTPAPPTAVSDVPPVTAAPTPPGGSADLAVTPGPSPVPPASTVVVHVAGEVHQPGLITLRGDTRAWHAIEAAGGPTGDADLDRINLAAPLTDGQQLHVPAVDQLTPPALVFPPPDPTPIEAVLEPTSIPVVDINRDGETALVRLPGIGPSLARAIVELRNARGPFFSVDELVDVPGIGSATLERIRPHVVAGTP